MVQLIELEYFEDCSRVHLTFYNDDLLEVIQKVLNIIHLQRIERRDKAPASEKYTVYHDFGDVIKDRKPILYCIVFESNLQYNEYQCFINRLRELFEKKDIYIKMLKYI